jgi:hypothetical protein
MLCLHAHSLFLLACLSLSPVACLKNESLTLISKVHQITSCKQASVKRAEHASAEKRKERIRTHHVGCKNAVRLDFTAGERPSCNSSRGHTPRRKTLAFPSARWAANAALAKCLGDFTPASGAHQRGHVGDCLIDSTDELVGAHSSPNDSALEVLNPSRTALIDQINCLVPGEGVSLVATNGWFAKVVGLPGCTLPEQTDDPVGDHTEHSNDGTDANIPAKIGHDELHAP